MHTLRRFFRFLEKQKAKHPFVTGFLLTMVFLAAALWGGWIFWGLAGLVVVFAWIGPRLLEEKPLARLPFRASSSRLPPASKREASFFGGDVEAERPAWSPKKEG